MPQASSTDFPLLFTISGGSRHEVLLVSPTASLRELSAQISEMVASSPNCEEFMSKYKKAGDKQQVTQMRVRWASEGRDTKLWPQATIVTEDNVDAVLMMIDRSGVGRDVLEVTMGEKEAKK